MEKPVYFQKIVRMFNLEKYLFNTTTRNILNYSLHVKTQETESYQNFDVRGVAAYFSRSLILSEKTLN